MPVVTLNKTVALFLVGYLGLAILVVRWQTAILPFWHKHNELAGSGASVLLGLLSLTLAALLGATINGVADVTIRPFVKWAARNERAALFFGQRRVFRSVSHWETRFTTQALAADEALFKSVAEDEFVPRINLATGLLHAHAPAHHMEWVAAHYSTFYLASNLTVVVLGGCVVIPSVGELAACGIAIALSIVAIAIYALLSLSIDRCLYTYQAEFRFASIWLAECATARAEQRRLKSLGGTT